MGTRVNNSNGWDFSEYSSQPSESGSGGGFADFGQGPGGSGQQQNGGYGGHAGHFAPQQGAPQNPFAQPNGPSPVTPFSAQGSAAGSPFAGGPAAAQNDLFGTAGALGAAPARLEHVSAPTAWLFAAIGLALVSGIVASILGGIPAVAIACWALAGPVAIGLFAVYLMNDVKARAHLTYSPPTWGPALYGVGLTVTFIAVIIASLQIAFWVGRL